MNQIEPDEVLDHPRRQAIMDAVSANPGITFRALVAATGIASGTLAHHTAMLSKHGVLVRRRVGPVLAHFAHASELSDGEVVLRRVPGLVPVLEALACLGRSPQRDIIRAVGGAASTVQHRLEQLERCGLVRSHRSGRLRLYEVVA